MTNTRDFTASIPPALRDTAIQAKIEAIWQQQPARYNKGKLVDDIIARLKSEHPEEWAGFITQSERDLVRSILSSFESRSRRHDRASLHAEAAAARAAAIEAQGHVGDARYAVKGGVFAWVRALTLDEVRLQAQHCRLVAKGANEQADRWEKIAARMVANKAETVGDVFSDDELDQMWADDE